MHAQSRISTTAELPQAQRTGTTASHAAILQLASPTDQFTALYRTALPEVFAYVSSRVGDRAAAEDVTQETFIAAARMINAGRTDDITVGWLVVVARNKLVDHYRRSERRQRASDRARPVGVDEAGPGTRARTAAAMERLSPSHRTALVLRYLDDLPVHEVAALMGRSIHATESLLVRARDAFKRSYGETLDD